MLNCRPIAKIKVENAMTTLTPNHFLIGKLGGAVSTDNLKNPTERWNRVHTLTDQFLETVPTKNTFRYSLQETNRKLNGQTLK